MRIVCNAATTRFNHARWGLRITGRRGWSTVAAYPLERRCPVQYVNLGSTGLRVSRVCLGMMSFGTHDERPWALPEAEAEPIIRRAVEGGITFFDTADVYNGGESEVITGRVLPKLLSREELVIATKVHGSARCPARTGAASRASTCWPRSTRSLQRLGLDYVDLYQIHRWDPLDPDRRDDGGAARRREGRQGALHRREQHVRLAVREGAGGRRPGGTTRFVSMQNHYNLVYREEEREMIPQCLDQGVARAPVEPARARPARRQPHARGGEADRARGHGPVRRLALRPERRLRGRRPRRPRSQPRAASRARRWRSPGCCSGRA